LRVNFPAAPFVIVFDWIKLEDPMAKKILFMLMLLVVVLFGNGCFVSVRQDVDFPAGRFAEARERVSIMESHNPDRVGRVAKMQTLVYDGKSRELVRVELPMWLVRMAMKHEGKNCPQQPHDVAGRYIDFDWRHLGNISRLGPGLLVQVEDMKENTHVLIWLE
jgi:hypothetical protein